MFYLLDLVLLLLDQVDNLVKLRCKKVKAGENGTVWPQRVRFHDLLILNRVADVNIAGVGDLEHRWVQIHGIGSLAMLAQIADQSVHKRGLARTCHSHHKKYYWGVLAHARCLKREAS